MTQDWTINGDYVEACNCNVACQCIFVEPPDDDICEVSIAFHIQDGQYGDVDLSGLSACWLVSLEGVMVAPDNEWDVVLLIDEAADEEQRRALEDIFTGQAGGLIAGFANHFRTPEVTTAPITFARDNGDVSMDIGDVVSLEVAGLNGFNQEGEETPATIAPHAISKNLEMNIGKSTTATVAYNDTFTWDVSGGNAFLGDFELANA